MGEQWIKIGALDLTSNVNALKANNPDIIFCSLLFAESPVFMKQAHAAGMFERSKLIFPMGGFQQTQFKKAFTPEGAILGVNTLWFDNPQASPLQKEFVSYYIDRFKDYPSSAADRAYFAMELYKGGVEKEPAPAHFRSYATATCDGILALLACRVPHDDERVIAAAKWLKDHPNVRYPQGVPMDSPERWGAAIRFYHYAVRAEVYRALEFPAEDRARVANALAMEQDVDGSFVNRVSPLMKEDDPVLCTALAMVALSNSL